MKKLTLDLRDVEDREEEKRLLGLIDLLELRMSSLSNPPSPCMDDYLASDQIDQRRAKKIRARVLDQLAVERAAAYNALIYLGAKVLP